MKKIFTYPDNESDHYIDPDYVGDDTVGFQKRVKELVDGNYKPWEGTSPSGTVDEVMADMSKFNNASWLENEGGNNSILSFWNNPMPQATMELIESDITSATAVHETTSNVEFSGDHGFYNQQLVKLSDFNGSWDTLNGRELYVKKIDSDTIQLATDSGLDRLIEFYDLANASVTSANALDPAVFNVTSHDVSDGDLVEMSNFDGSFDRYNGQQFYIQNQTATSFNVSFDEAGNNLLSFPTASTDNDLEYLMINQDGSVDMYVDTALDQIPDGAQITMDANDSTTHSPRGSGLGLSTELNLESPLYSKGLSDDDSYRLFYDEHLTDKVNWRNDLNPNQFIKDTPVSVVVDDDDNVKLKLTFTGTDSQDLSGELISDFQKIDGTDFSGINKTQIYYAERDSGDNYFMHTSNTLDAPVNVNQHIIRPLTVGIKSFDKRYFVPEARDNDNNTLTSSRLVIDKDFIKDQAALEERLLNEDWKYTFVTPAFGVDSNAGDLSISTSTFGENEDLILEVSNSDDWHGLKDYIETSDRKETAISFRGDNSRLMRIMGNVGPTQDTRDANMDFYNVWNNAYTADPNSVIGAVFVATNLRNTYIGPQSVSEGVTMTYEWGGEDTENQFYMIPFGKIPGTTQFSWQMYECLPDGTMGGNLQGMRYYGSTNPDHINLFEDDNGKYGRYAIRAYPHLNFYNHDRSGDATETVVEATGISNNMNGNAATYYNVNAKFRTGDMVKFELQDNSTGFFNNMGWFIVNETSTSAVTDQDDVRLQTITLLPAAKIDTNLAWSFDNMKWDEYTGHNDGLEDVINDSGILNRGTARFTTIYKSALTKRGSDWNTKTFTSTDYDVKPFGYQTDDLYDTVTTDTKAWTNQTGTRYTDVTTFDIGYTYVDATQGDYAEVFTPATDNIIPRAVLSGATSGTLTISNSEPNRYRIASVDINMYGNQTYLQRTGDATYVNNARLDDSRYIVAGLQNDVSSYTHWPDTTVSTNSSGYITGFSFDTEFPGAFRYNDDHMFEVETVPNTYTPPSQSIASQQDNWDLDDAWTVNSYVGGSGKKEWPSHVTPSTAEIVLNTPTIVNRSQNGIKYARKSSFTKWTLEVEYPAMTKQEFQIFHGIAQAAQGQAVPFLFKLENKDGVNILWKDWSQNTDGTLFPIFKEDMAAVTTTALFEGFASDTNKAFARGEVISLVGGNDNGDLHTVLTDVDSNAYGEAKIRLTYPVKGSNNKGDSAFKQPSGCVVTLNSDDFTYSVDHMGYYYVSVAFELDNYK